MPRKRLPARLKLRRRHGREARWIIVDGRKEIDTGCGESARGNAETKFGEYLAASRRIDTAERNPARVAVADVIALYVKANPAPPAIYHARPLLAFFGEHTLSEINGQLCRGYATTRGHDVSASTVRRELVTLQAAVNLWHQESPLDAVPRIVKPLEAKAKERFLSRHESARLLNAARRLGLRYLARFILIGLYTGTRHGAILRLRWYPSVDAGWIDAERGIIHRSGTGEAATRKRRGTSRIPARLMAHVRIWARRDLESGPQSAIVRWKGKPIEKERRAWASAVKAAGMGSDVAPHCLKHTCCSWALASGMNIWDLAGLTSTSVKTLESTYGHHAPEFQQATAKAFRRKA
jgi:integrase